MPRNKRRKQMKRKSRNTRRKDPSSGPEFRGDKVTRLTLPFAPYLLTTTVTSGVIASSTVLDPPAQVTGWSTRFLDTYQEYQVRGFKIRARLLTQSTGVTKMYFRRVSGALLTPTANAAFECPGKTSVNNSSNSTAVVQMSYRCKDFAELDWQPIAGTTQARAIPTFNVYTDSANYGAPVTATALWLIEGSTEVIFRGVAST